MQTGTVHRTGPQGEQLISDAMKIASGLSQRRLDNDQCAIVREPLKQHLDQLDLSLQGIMRGALQLVERIGDDDDMIRTRLIDELDPRISFKIGMNAVETGMVSGIETTVLLP